MHAPFYQTVKLKPSSVKRIITPESSKKCTSRVSVTRKNPINYTTLMDYIFRPNKYIYIYIFPISPDLFPDQAQHRPRFNASRRQDGQRHSPVSLHATQDSV